MSKQSSMLPFLAVSYLVFLGTGSFGSRSFPPKTDPQPPLTHRRLNEHGDYSTYAPAPGPSEYCESYSERSCFTLPIEAYGLLAADISTEVYKNTTDDTIYTYLRDTLYATDIRFVTDEYTNTEAIVVFSDNLIFLAFRGTSEYTDYLVNASVDFTNVFLGNWTANIHSGYVAAVESVYRGVIDIIDELDPDITKDIIITGHSLGGALASVAAAVFQADQYFLRYIFGIYTFGSPRVGDASWVDAYYNLGLWDKTLRYANKRDPIPAIPSRSSGFAHVGWPMIIDEDSSDCSVAEESDEDFDLCSELGFFESLGAVGCDFFGILVTAPTCVAAALVPGEQKLCGVMLDILDDGQACCSVGAKDFHGIDYYLSVVGSQCTSACSYTQYLQCGAGYGDYDYDIGDYDYEDEYSY